MPCQKLHCIRQLYWRCAGLRVIQNDTIIHKPQSPVDRRVSLMRATKKVLMNDTFRVSNNFNILLKEMWRKDVCRYLVNKCATNGRAATISLCLWFPSFKYPNKAIEEGCIEYQLTIQNCDPFALPFAWSCEDVAHRDDETDQ